MSKGKRLIALCLLLAALSAGSVALSRYNEEQESAQDAGAEADENVVELEDIQRIDVAFEGERVSMQREGDAWIDVDDPAFPLDATYPEQMASALAQVTSTRSVTGDLAEYGLDEPQLTISVTDAAGEVTTLLVGDRNGVTGLYYARLDGSETVYTIASSEVSPFMRTRYEMIETEAFPTVATDSVTRVTLTSGEAQRTLVHREDGWPQAYSASFTWFEPTEAGGLSVVDADGAESWLGSALNVTYLGTAVYDATDADVAACGLDAPAVTLEIAYAHSAQVELDALEALQARALLELTPLRRSGLLDDWTIEEHLDAAERIERLWSGTDDGARTYDVSRTEYLTVWISEPDADGVRYMRHSASERIFTVAESYALTLAGLTDLDLTETAVCQVEMDRVNRLTIAAEGMTKVIEVDRAPVLGDDGFYDAHTAYRLNGEEIESSQFTGFMTLLNQLNAEAYTDSQDVGNVCMTVILEQQRASHPSMTLTLYDYDANFYRASFAGRIDMLVSKRDVETLLDRFEQIGATETAETADTADTADTDTAP